MNYQEGFHRVESTLGNMYRNRDTIKGAFDAVVDAALGLGLTEVDVQRLALEALK